MTLGKTRSTARSITATALLLAAAHAHAEASLTLTPVSSTCSTYFWGPGPATPPFNGTQTQDCTGGTVSNGQAFTTPSGYRSWMEVVYDFTYSDDGLRLPQMQILDGLYPAVTEAGMVSVHVDASGSPYTVAIDWSGEDADGSFQADSFLMLGLNNHPDSFAGRVTITISPVSNQANTQIFDVDVRASVASVAAIPEPSTYALMFAGLIALGLTTRRRHAPRLTSYTRRHQ